MWRRIAVLTDTIIRGVSSADLPIREGCRVGLRFPTRLSLGDSSKGARNGGWSAGAPHSPFRDHELSGTPPLPEKRQQLVYRVRNGFTENPFGLSPSKPESRTLRRAQGERERKET